MSEQPEDVGKAQLSKAGKAIMFHFDKPVEIAMISVESMRKLLDKEWSYIKIRRPSK